MARTKEFDEATVLDRAMITFWEKGYEKTSMQDLVDHMGIHRRSIYDTFGDKHTLFLLSLDRYAFELEKKITHNIKKDMPIREKLEVLFTLVLAEDSTSPRGCLIVNTAAELSLLDEEVSEKVQALFTRSETFIYQLLVDAQKKGEIQNEHDLKEIAVYLHNAWVGFRILAKTTNDQKKLQSIIQISLSII